MAVQFILGRSGTGKTSYCIKAIADALAAPGRTGEPLILLVPEQASYQAERSILADKRIAGYNRLNVLSFDRLQFLLLGKNAARPSLSRIGRAMVVHRILSEQHENLKIFRGTAANYGLSEKITQIIDELHQYAKTPDDIDLLIEKIQKFENKHLTALKFNDVRLILREYLEFISNDFFDSDIQLKEVCSAIGSADFIKGAEIWVDGFAGFTESELLILAELLKSCNVAHIALCIDPDSLNLSNPQKQDLDPLSLFYPTEATYCSITEFIRKNNLKLAEPVILRKVARFNCSELAHIERYIFTNNPPKISAENINILSASNERTEAKYVAGRITEMVRNQHYRYRDIAVVASNINLYSDYLTAYFNDYGIPFFIDRRKPLNKHPLARLINSALQIAAGNFTVSNIFTYLRTGFVDIEHDEIDLLENYCIAFGVLPDDWLIENKWEFSAGQANFDQEHINYIRDKVTSPLFAFRNKLADSDSLTAEQFTMAVFDFLDGLKVCDTLGRMIENAHNTNDIAAADEHQQFYSNLVNIFNELTYVFAGRAGKVEDFVLIINSAFSQMSMAFIPRAMDQVLIGSIERSRHPDLKVIFLIGATEKQFPVSIEPDSILSDQDRRLAEKNDFIIAPANDIQLQSSQYLAYIAFTRASEQIYITYPSVDEKGNAVPISHLINDLKSLFDNVTEKSIADEITRPQVFYNQVELADMLCERLGRDAPGDGSDKEYLELLAGICSDEQLAPLGNNIIASLNYDNSAILETPAITDVFKRFSVYSATRLSTFAACPYQHFAKYVLELKQRDEFKFEPLDVGNFYHNILDALLRKIVSAGKNFNSIDDAELLELLKEQFEVLIHKDSFLSNFISRREYNRFIIESAGEFLENFVIGMAEICRAGSFTPVLSEVTFGPLRDNNINSEHQDSIGECIIALDSGRFISLAGKIDRLDIADSDNGKAAVVFDYKRSAKSFSWMYFYHGLDIQLPVYMLAVNNSSKTGGLEAAGAFYLPIEGDNSRKFRYKANGLFNGDYADKLDKSACSKYYNYYVTKDGDIYGKDNISGALRQNDFEKVLDFTKRKIINLADRVFSGEITIAPYRLKTKSPCGFCIYKPVCRFDWQVNSYNFLETVNKNIVLEKAGDTDG